MLIKHYSNCSFPYRTYLPEASICGPSDSQRAAEIYNNNRYPSNKVCPRSCTKMKISTVYLARYVNDKKNNFVTFNFGKLIDVTVEVKSYRFLNMVAEIGGYLGLTLGVSLHDVNTIITAIKHKTYF